MSSRHFFTAAGRGHEIVLFLLDNNKIDHKFLVWALQYRLALFMSCED
jgi:hypothetical protein